MTPNAYKVMALLYFLAQAAAGTCVAEDEPRPSSVIKNNIVQYPLTYRSEPIGFKQYPWGYQEVNRNVMAKPYGYREQPLNYREKILTDIGTPRGYSPTPPNFILREAHPLVNTDASKQMLVDSHPNNDTDSSKRISIESNPNTSKIVKSVDID
ncbi:MAG: hypothetical protein WCG06_03485 [Candidatus Omnitrophota bacterium]